MAGVSDSDRCKRDRWVGREDVFQLQSDNEAAVSASLTHIGDEISQGVDYDVLFSTVGT